MTDRPWSGRRLHILGVAGAGMSAYARAAAALGATVTGSDRADSPFAQALAADGVLLARIGHAAGNIPQGEVEVFCSSAIPEENVERLAALERGLSVRTRAELLGELTGLRRTIAVAGAHGKTTTSSMIVSALRRCGLDPGYLIGGTLRETGRNGDWATGEWLIVEADESDRSMLALDVEIAVLTSVELDHHAAFGSRLELEGAYREFLARPAEAVIWARPELLALRTGRVAAYDVASVEAAAAGRSRFRTLNLDVSLRVPGVHNVLNAAAALEVCRLVGADLDIAVAALADFTGVARRFELLGRTPAGATVYDDYAHHPTEVAATLEAARTLGHDRVVAAFQPHLYSRTERLAREFGEALSRADVVVVLDVYPARERAEDFPGVSGRLIAGAAVDAAEGRPVYWLPTQEAAERLLVGLLGPGDVCLVLGAGDVDGLGRRLIG